MATFRSQSSHVDSHDLPLHSGTSLNLFTQAVSEQKRAADCR
jgi:hypothetical protein